MTANIESSVKFRNMNSDEFKRFTEWSINHYAEELLLSKQYDTPEKALQKSKCDFYTLLSNGFNTKDNFLMVVVNDKHEDVGIIWYNINENGIIFICDLVVFENYRRRNYGYMTLAQLEIIASEISADAITLHVFSYNTPALNLYKKFGFVIDQEQKNGDIFMRKKCKKYI